MKKKKVSEKKKKSRDWMGYCPFESRYNGLYRDIGQLGTVVGATTRPTVATIRPRGPATRPAARAHSLAAGCVARQATTRSCRRCDTAG